LAEISFGEWLKRRRKGMGLTQRQLAARINCSTIMLKKVEAEERRPSAQIVERLAEIFNISPSEQIKFLHFARGDWKSAPPSQSEELPWHVSGITPRSNLPTPLTSFIGREKDLKEILGLLSSCRLLTLTGPSGVGKTRLAIQTAHESIKKFNDGVFWVSLVGLSDGSLIPQEIAQSLNVRGTPGEPFLETLKTYLETKDVLLVIDNCEHLIRVFAEYAEQLLTACPKLKILATSIEVLGLFNELVWQVPSLPLPEKQERLSLMDLKKFASIELFDERAGTAKPGFALDERNASSVSQICHYLDGIPLAIELAAARVKVLSVDEIAARLDDCFSLLTTGSRTAILRHKTLRATMDWSYELLTESERTLFRRLSVFASGFTLESAEVVCSQGMQRKDMLDLLGRLVDKSLVIVDTGSEITGTRYRLLETIRQYAHEKLVDAKESELLCDQHLHFFVRLAEHTQPIFQTIRRTEWLPRLELDHANLRAALEWACERDVETARWLAGMLERFWFYSDHLSEAHTWYGRVLESGDRAPVSKGLALALFGSGCISLNLGYIDEAQARLEQSAVLWQQIGEQRWLASSFQWLAYLLLQRGDEERACTMYAEHESLFRAASDPLLLAWTLGNWGIAKCAARPDDPTGKALLDEALSFAHTLQDPFCFVLCYSSLGDWAVLQGDYATARQHFLKALECRRQLGTRWIIVAGLWQVANTMCLQGDYPQAEPMYAEALALSRALGDQRSEAHIAQELGAVAIKLGDVERAMTLLAESLASFRKWADSLGIVRCLMGLADLQRVHGHMEQAARVLSFVELWLQSNQIQLVHFDRTNYGRSVVAARVQLDEATFAKAWAEGRAMTMQQAIAYALKLPASASVFSLPS
jgi:predicted ATPase/transcriptional regulator with XRE-family HTH domain